MASAPARCETHVAAGLEAGGVGVCIPRGRLQSVGGGAWETALLVVSKCGLFSSARVTLGSEISRADSLGCHSGQVTTPVGHR